MQIFPSRVELAALCKLVPTFLTARLSFNYLFFTHFYHNVLLSILLEKKKKNEGGACASLVAKLCNFSSFVSTYLAFLFTICGKLSSFSMPSFLTFLI